MYKFYNANIKKNDVDDCTIRAISLAEGITWNEAYKKLSYLARINGEMLDSVKFIEDYLDSNYRRVHRRARTVGEFADEYSTGIYLITVPHHITVCCDGCVYDTFDCSDREILSAWRVK